MKQFLSKPILALLIPFVLSACAPALNNPLVTVVDGFTFAPGQRWEVQATGGQGYSDTVEFDLVSASLGTDESGFEYVSKRLDARMAYSDLQRSRSTYFIAYWSSKAEKTKGLPSSCNIRLPKLISFNPPTFEGRWAISLNASSRYLDTGDTKGMGTCTIKLIQE
jgi:hypothetical protein